MQLLGSQVLSFDISTKRDFADITSFGDPYPKKVLISQETKANVVVLLNYDIIRVLESILESGFVAKSLGPGQRCAYCGSLWLPGILVCPACGGYTLPMGKSIEMTRDGILTSFHTWDGDQRFGPSKAELEFYITGDIPLGTADVKSLLFSKPGPWLCEYCGLICAGPDFRCPGCGGKRPAVKELLKMRRTCIYCGKETYGNFRCPACRGRLS